jgi:hypothetical protein
MLDFALRILAALALIWSSPGLPSTPSRATMQPYPTIVPATPGPSPTPEAAYPAPYPAPQERAALPDPHFTARYLPSGAIVVSWTQTTRGCLAMGAALIGCYDGPGRVAVEIGAVGPVDANARGSAYQAEIDGVRYRARVESVVYFPSFYL